MLESALLPLQNDSVRLRPLRRDDAPAFAAGSADPAVRRYGHLPEPEYTPSSVRTMIADAVEPGLQRGDLAVLAIADATTDAFAGSLVLFDVEEEHAEVGFWVHPDHRGAGRTAAALDLAASFAARSGVRVLTARTSPENSASQRALATAGFTRTRHERSTAPSGQTVELLSYSRRLPTESEPPIRTERLSLRRHRPDDTGWLQQIYSRPDVARYLLDEPWTQQDAATYVEQRLTKTDLDGPAGALSLVIERDGTPIGDVQLWFTDRERRIAEIGWVLDPDHARQGFAAEAVRAVLDLGFDRSGLHRVTAQMDARNTASARLASRVGLRQEAHLREDWWSKGEWTDTLIFAMLAADRCATRNT